MILQKLTHLQWLYAVLSDGVPPVASPFILDIRSKRFVVQEEVVDIIM